MTCLELYNLTRKYDLEVTKLHIGYGNGFEKQGKAYFTYLCNIRPDFKQWVINNEPRALPYIN